MTGARKAILQKIGASAPALEWPSQRLVPAYTQQPHAVLVQMFADKVLASHCTMEEVVSATLVPERVAAFVEQSGLGAEVVVSDVLDNLPWSETEIVKIGVDLTKDGIVAVTDCFAGVAETGTLVMLNNGGRDSRLNFVSALHIVVLEASAIVGPYEDVWARMAESDIAVPRAVNFITGPSRTADIEQTIELGAHGPGQVHIMLIDPRGSDE
jgi:L-lactate utilization protein LutC